MSMDMFISLNNDILQCILYEWLDIQDICQLDIAVCNHNLRPLYYEALQTSISPLKKDFKGITENRLYNLVQWCKKREIKNPFKEIDIEESERFLPYKLYCELEKDFKRLTYTKSLTLSYRNPFLFYALSSLKCLTSLELFQLELYAEQHAELGLLLKQLPSLEHVFINLCPFEPILISLLSEIPSLTSLEFQEFDISTSFIKELSKLTHLQSLTFGDSQTDFLDLSFLPTFSHLTKLSLQLCSVSLQHILTSTQLKEFELSCVDLEETNNINYENYLPLHQLESFEVNGTNIHYDLIPFILQSKQLTNVEFEDCLDVQSSSFYEIDKLLLLTHLSLGKLPIDEQLFNIICKLPRLVSLYIYQSPNLTDNDYNISWWSFSKLNKQLTTLSLLNQPLINKRYIEEISQLEKLSYLSFSWDSNSYELLQPLSQLKQLKNLHLNFISTISVDDLKIRIKNMIPLPKLKIEFIK